MDRKITAPADDDITQLARQWLVAEQLVCEARGVRLSGTEADLEGLQVVVDSGILRADQTYEWQCLGFAFGSSLISACSGLDWVVVEDEYGRDPALRFETTSILLFPLTMISKRVEDGEVVDLRALFDGVLERVARLKTELGWQGKGN